MTVTSLRTWPQGSTRTELRYCPDCNCRKSGWPDEPNAVDPGCVDDGACACHHNPSPGVCSECGADSNAPFGDHLGDCTKQRGERLSR